jgi:hypothetical protein
MNKRCKYEIAIPADIFGSNSTKQCDKNEGHLGSHSCSGQIIQIININKFVTEYTITWKTRKE